MAVSESRVAIHHITARSRHLEKMNAVKAQREPAGRYIKSRAGSATSCGGSDR